MIKQLAVAAITLSCLHTQAQNVGIGTTNPSEYFTVKRNGIGLSQESANGTVKIGLFTDDTSARLQTHSNHALHLSTNNRSPQVTLLPNGNVGIGTSIPANKLQIGNFTTNSYSSDDIAIGYYIHATGMRQDVNGFVIRSSSNIYMRPSNGNGYFGINADAVANKLQIGSVGSTGFSGNDIVFGNGAEVTAFAQTSTRSQMVSNTDIVLMPKNNGFGYVGINTYTPTNKLQIGSVGTTGFGGNDIAFGNGTNVMAMFQGNSFAQIASTTDIAFMPRNNGKGRIGINTITPQYPLHVEDFVSTSGFCYAYFARHPTICMESFGGNLSTVPASIYASSRVLATEFNAYSDARIKNVIAQSNSANDLSLLESIRITDYTMKDIAKYGNKQYKKVIAQELEKVYPQAVSQQPDFIPNVYQVATKITNAADGYHLHFNKPHQLSANAKKLRLLLNDNHHMDECSIVAIPSPTEVVIKTETSSIKQAFVYGEEVPDFRTVDYEGLTTLNISATQELSKQVKQQQATIDLLLKEVNALKQQLAAPVTTKIAAAY